MKQRTFFDHAISFDIADYKFIKSRNLLSAREYDSPRWISLADKPFFFLLDSVCELILFSSLSQILILQITYLFKMPKAIILICVITSPITFFFLFLSLQVLTFSESSSFQILVFLSFSCWYRLPLWKHFTLCFIFLIWTRINFSHSLSVLSVRKRES